jgi:hypothetical protein
MMIVAGISNPEEVNELVSITKSFAVANRAKELAHEVRTE